ncbi:MFS transporter [Photorhabdus laumondii subsp. laumondii]|uniref:Photorhabdus luminescens subsp. laumondii TTO1 complete genome segment 2/17 n=3 Tax=Photorhabdus laumondii TaxID=2218628 RepID=Q7N971_PHOLL|nr:MULTISPECIES: MFS transporter [Photorhabdus]AWK40440.1 MFS transporter [Photorhabdus laumondii subsp. laumondii]AXG41248.1 MFS transporter [Photorhabdus laumondii subsp. laumondii]AXG45779.1 MFS transporter [Photorhabdus laumondii subsp. laumondii]KTL62371.1 MFS transporter [Photorhabdus laumondii subsp. laumondii]MCC8386392.1 MFS transporter [Photorhabdus laumondii]
MSDQNIVSLVKQPIMATRAAFFIAGFSLASWAPLIPLAKERLQLDNGAMGLLMLAFGIGSFIMMPIAGMLAARFGCRQIFTLCALVVLVMLPGLSVLPTPLTLACVLFIFGAGIGAMDVVVNIHAVMVEKMARRPIMSGFHALFSLGGIAGAGSVSALLSLGISPLQAMVMVVLLVILLLLPVWSGLLNEAESDNTPFFAMPHGIVILLGFLCFVAYIMEGSMLDWSGILLTSVHNISSHQAGIGYTLFAIAMTSGRFLGDKIIALYGHRRVFISSALLATSGFILIYSASTAIMLGLSFLMIGAGLSNIAPMLFTASGQQKIMPDSLAVAAVSTMGYSGILLGPAIIGGLAHIVTLHGAFACIALLSISLLAGYKLINSSGR